MERKTNIQRSKQIKQTVVGSKIQQFLDKRDYFVNEMIKFVQSIPQKEVTEDQEKKIIEGRDISVCIRARPLLEHETREGYFDIVYAKKPNFYLLEPKLNVSL